MAGLVPRPYRGRASRGWHLEPRGKIVSGPKGQTIIDGPFAESKEAVGGYFLLQVNSLDEAVAIAQECPGLPYGAKIEVRPVMEVCTMSAEGQNHLRTLELAA